MAAISFYNTAYYILLDMMVYVISETVEMLYSENSKLKNLISNLNITDTFVVLVLKIVTFNLLIFRATGAGFKTYTIVERIDHN